ncbi:MAG: hypothetical protein WEA77_06045 [Hyphomonas sp.]|uniref:hypothetical protein n=1 Tax=Hyphomonas sp. TaxID=87 RepID=UPI00349FFB5E
MTTTAKITPAHRQIRVWDIPTRLFHWSLLLLLTTVSVCILAGLFSSGESLTGPFADTIGFEMSEVHELAFRVLQDLVALNLPGVVAESWLAEDALIPAMITGRKSRTEG